MTQKCHEYKTLKTQQRANLINITKALTRLNFMIAVYASYYAFILSIRIQANVCKLPYRHFHFLDCFRAVIL